MQQFENNLIYPRVVGNSVGLPGIWVLLSIVVFGGLLGLFGMLIAVPATAVLYTLLGEFVNGRMRKKGQILDESGLLSLDQFQILSRTLHLRTRINKLKRKVFKGLAFFVRLGANMK